MAIAAGAGPISRGDLTRFLHVSPGEIDDTSQPVERYLLPDAELQYVHVELRRRVQLDTRILVPVRTQLVAWGDEALGSGRAVPAYAGSSSRSRAHRRHLAIVDVVTLIQPPMDGVAWAA